LMQDKEDPYIWLEAVDSVESLDFARAANEACLSALGHPETTSNTYSRVLAALESDDRIPHASQHGHDNEGNAIVYNFWKDATNPKGLWRKTTMESYRMELAGSTKGAASCRELAMIQLSMEAVELLRARS
jgi:prolyl oligopeptidase